MSSHASGLREFELKVSLTPKEKQPLPWVKVPSSPCLASIPPDVIHTDLTPLMENEKFTHREPHGPKERDQLSSSFTPGETPETPTCANKDCCPSLWEFLHHLSAFAIGGRLSWPHLTQATEGREVFSTDHLPSERPRKVHLTPRASPRDSMGTQATTPAPVPRVGPRGNRRTGPTGIRPGLLLLNQPLDSLLCHFS